MIYSREDISREVSASLHGRTPSKVLLIPPDYTRLHSYAGIICAEYYRQLSSVAEVRVLPALGTHAPMTEHEFECFFEGEIPIDRMLVHNWRTDVRVVGEVPADFMTALSDGMINEAVPVGINRNITDGGFDLAVSIGQVVPHEVAGMSNHLKNILVGCGGSEMINLSHMLGATYGIDRIIGRTDTPVRRLFDRAGELLPESPRMIFALTVVSDGELRGLFIGEGRTPFDRAAKLSAKLNITHTLRPVETAVAYLRPDEYHSTWLGNKAIYRLRPALAPGGRLIILAPGVRRFGEDAECDRLIRKYGYSGRNNILRLSHESGELKSSLSAAAHLIHGSTEGAFEVIYATGGLSSDEVEGVGYRWADCEQLLSRFNPDTLTVGFHTADNGEEFYYAGNPALGLWTV